MGKKKEQSGLARQLGGNLIKLAHANTHTCLLVARRLLRPCSSPPPGYDHQHHSQLAGKERLETLLVMSRQRLGGTWCGSRAVQAWSSYLVKRWSFSCSFLSSVGNDWQIHFFV